MVRAKFKCIAVTQTGEETFTYKFSAAVAGEDNKQWSKWTPAGTLEMMVTNPDAKFEFGKEYYLDFTQA